MDKYDIKAHIKRNGSSLTAIAESLNPPVSATAVAKVIDGTGTSQRIAKAISETTGLSLSELWGDKYKAVA